MRALFLVLGLALSVCGGAFADAVSDCNQNKDGDLSIRNCTLIIEGQAKGDKAKAYNSRGVTYENKGEHDRAITDYDQAIRLDPNFAKAYLNRGASYYGKSDYDRAIQDYTEAIQMDATGSQGCRPCALKGRGQAYDSKGDYDRAIADYDQATRLDPKDADTYIERGVSYYGKEDYDRAIADFDQAIRIDPKSAVAYVNRGSACIAKGDYDRAIADFDQAIRIDPKSAVAYFSRGAAYFAKGDYDHAMADEDEAVRLDPKSVSAYSWRGWVRQIKGDRERAVADFNEAARLDPKDAGAGAGRGHAFLAMGKTDAAIEDFNESLRLKADNVTALWGRGQVYEQQGLRSLALADYKKAIELKAVGPVRHNFQNKARARLIALEAPTAPSLAQTSAQVAASGKPQLPMARRVALVIGNGAYKSVGELGNPKNDAAAVAGGLMRLGFEVIEKHDLGVIAMRKALGEFEDKATGAEWTFVYYAGHGMELNGKNWLIPVDAELARASDTADEAVPLERVLERVSAGSKLRIVILDACRNNPFITRMVMNRTSTRAVARGLTAVEPSHGEVVFYAARDGSVALDGKSGNSPFATALVKHMDEDGVELGRFFRKVTSSVLAATGNQQEPFVYGRIPDEDFYFKPPK